MRSIALILSLVAAVAGAENWNGWLDTAAIATFNGTETAYTAAFDLGSYENSAVLVKVNDTSSAGFSGDSIKFAWGYQTGTLTKGTDGVVDTLWDPIIYVDTVSSDSLGKRPAGYTDSDLKGYRNSGWVDTSSVTGWATQMVQVVPEWRPLIRYAVLGLTGNKAVTPLRLVFQQMRRQGMALKDR